MPVHSTGSTSVGVPIATAFARGAQRHGLAQHRIDLDRQMRPMLLQRRHRHDDNRVLPRLLAQLVGAQLAPLDFGHLSFAPVR